jgi:hypothetical protein
MRPTFRWQPGDPWSQPHNLQDQVNQLLHRWGDQGRELFGLGGFPRSTSGGRRRGAA